MSLGRRDVPRTTRVSGYTLGGVLAGLGLLGLVALIISGGGSRPAARPPASRAAVAQAPLPGDTTASSAPRGVARAPRGGGPTATPARRATPNAGAAVPGAVGGAVAVPGVSQPPDPEASQSFPAPTTVHHAPATSPAAAASAAVAAGAPSDAEIRRELRQMQALAQAERQQALAAARGGSIGGAGTVTPPPGVPVVVARVIAGGNAIATFPYRFGGGHASFVDDAYDCSASVSYALAAGGLIAAPVTSGQLESWGVVGPGRWITVFANAGHTYMYVNGLRFDTSGRSGIFGSRWQPAARSNVSFVARHWPGL